MEKEMENQEMKQPAGWARPSMVLLYVDLVVVVLLAIMTLRTVPKFTVAFRELLGTTPLPLLTELFVSISATGYLVLFSCVIIVLVVKEIVIKNKARALAINSAILIAGILYLVLYVTAMLLPLTTIINDIAD
jgi:CBS domain containing-hemolysin-like protein